MILLLGGTEEGRDIAEGLARLGRPAIASLAGATRAPRETALVTRVGGFGGAAGFECFLDAAGITAVIDATHPFASRISERTAAICAARGLPYLLVLRPPWQPGPGDRWTEAADETEAAARVPAGATVFLGTGPGRLERFAGLAGRRVICRRIDPPDAPFPFEGGEFLIDRPPFTVAGEEALFRDLGVDWLVAKNAGGRGGAAKLAAARRLGLPVMMIRRPAPPDAPRVETADAALDWAAEVPA